MAENTPTDGSAMGLLYTTWPDADSAAAAAETLLGEGLIACANILSESTSIYRWKGAVERETEIVALFKTSAARAGETRDRLAALHPYEEPCILSLAVGADASAAGFLEWLKTETGAA